MPAERVQHQAYASSVSAQQRSCLKDGKRLSILMCLTLFPLGQGASGKGMGIKVRNSIWKIVSALPALVMMAVIFAFSAKTAVESTESSNRVVDMILGVTEGVFGTIQANREQLYEILEVIVRKGAHMTEYALLCLLVAFHLHTWKLEIGRLCLSAVAVCAAYAASDEFHQLFVQGRSGQLTDVFIDTAGAVIAAGVLAAVYHLCTKRRHRKQATEQEASK